MKYQHYHFKDFMLDESFQQWVLEPESQPDSFWFTWVSRHPEKENEIRQARQAILELYQTGARKEVALPASARRPEMATASQDKAATWFRISQAIDAGEAAPSPAPEARVFQMLPPVWLKMAAAVLLLLGLALVFWLRPNRGTPALVAYETAFGQTRRVTLPDRSVIILNANSRLTFARTWAAGQDREVTFAGRIDGYETRKIGGYDYRFPRVVADVVYLWPVRDRVDVIERPVPYWWGAPWGWWY